MWMDFEKFVINWPDFSGDFKSGLVFPVLHSSPELFLILWGKVLHFCNFTMFESSNQSEIKILLCKWVCFNIIKKFFRPGLLVKNRTLFSNRPCHPVRYYLHFCKFSILELFHCPRLAPKVMEMSHTSLIHSQQKCWDTFRHVSGDFGSAGGVRVGRNSPVRPCLTTETQRAPPISPKSDGNVP